MSNAEMCSREPLPDIDYSKQKNLLFPIIVEAIVIINVVPDVPVLRMCTPDTNNEPSVFVNRI